MIFCIGNVLSPELLGRVHDALAEARFVDGRETAGWHARLVKNNRQLAGRDPNATRVRAEISDALKRHEVFRAAVLPRRFRPLLFSRYETGMSYGSHVDDGIMGGDDPVRTDVSFTIFLTPPESYDGGELVVESTAGEQAYKLDAGQAIVYPSTSLHRVATVTRGRRDVVVGWAQSLVRQADRREILFDLDAARRSLFQQHGKTREFDHLSKTYANLLRMWAEP